MEGTESFLKVVSLNVRGLINKKKRISIFHWARTQNADIVMLQEAHSSKEVEIGWQKEWGGKIIFSHGSSNSRGVMMLFKNDTDIGVNKIFCDKWGRIISVHIQFMEKMFLIANIYAPNIEDLQIQFFKNLHEILLNQWESNEQVIIGGDFNCIFDPFLDKAGGRQLVKKRVVKEIEAIKLSFDLIDIWRLLHPDQHKFTWRQNSPLVQCRLDFFLIEQGMKKDITKVNIISALRTDHKAIEMRVKIENNQRGKGYWKMNTSVLENERYVKSLVEHIKRWKIEYESMDPKVKWDLIKFKIMCFTIDFTKQLKKEENSREVDLINKIENMEKEIAKQHSIQLVQDVEKLKAELIKIDDKKIEGIIIRARSIWHEKGEKNSKYFLGLEKRNHTKKTCNSLIVDGETITDKKQILKNQKAFYKDLYESQANITNQDNMYDFIRTVNIPKLTEEEKGELDQGLTKDECFEAMNCMANNKSPGNDGLPIEFYKCFWNNISDIFIESASCSLKMGELSTSQKQAVITLIKKEGKDDQYLKNWRPISLLNADYKIISKALSMRICKILPKLINTDQTGFMKGRFIGESVRTILDIMQYTKEKDMPGLLLFLDYEKAFDSLEWPFLFKILEKFNFGESFIKYIQCLYTNIQSCINNNGFTSGYFPVQRGVRQGDPLSPYLFILAVESLACAIRQHKGIRGIEVNDTTIQIVQYADDTTMVLSDNKSFENVSALISYFATFSGLKLNFEKSKLMWLGSKRNSKEKLPKVELSKNPIKALGFYFTYDMELCESLNFDTKLSELQKILNIWKTRNLTLIGKIQIIKSFALSKLIYVSSILPVPGNLIKKIEGILYNFIWNGKKGQIKRTTLIGPIEKGGLNMIDIESMFKALKVKWIQRLLQEENARWKEFFWYHTKHMGKELILYSNCRARDLKAKQKIPRFYTEILSYLMEMDKSTHEGFSISKFIIWNNYDIKINDKVIFFKSFFENGMVYIQDLYNEEGNLYDFDTWKRKGVNRMMNLNWCSVISAIPKKLKIEALKKRERENTKQPINLCFTLNENVIPFNTAATKQIYSFFRNLKFTMPTSEAFWNSKYNLQPDDWGDIYRLPFFILQDTKSRIFQYKINMNILVTNLKLTQMKLGDNELCSFCGREKETLEHIFVNCVYTRNFWQEFITWWNGKQVNRETVITFPEGAEILLGVNITNKSLLLRSCLIWAKQTIYKCRILEISPSMALYLGEMEKIYKIEKNIACSNNQLEVLEKKWKILKMEG